MSLLKEQTRHHHDHIENTWFAKALLNKPEKKVYLKILQRWYGFFSGYAQSTQQFALFNNDLVTIRLQQLTADIIGLGADQHSIDQLPCFSVPITTVYQAYGVSYVLEGSGLGGQVICRYLTSHAEPEVKNNIRFFNGFGQNTNNRWQQYCHFMNNQVFTDYQVITIIGSAKGTFDVIEQWFGTQDD